MIIVLNTIKITLSYPDFLIRVYKHMSTSQLIFVLDLNMPFDLEFRHTLSVNEFVADLAEHLSKI